MRKVCAINFHHNPGPLAEHLRTRWAPACPAAGWLRYHHRLSPERARLLAELCGLGGA